MTRVECFQPITGDPGFENNVMTVQSSDFEVFEALAMDSVSTGHSKTGAPLEACCDVLPTILILWIVCSGVDHSPPGEYGQNIPFKELQGGFPTGPPILPPHLLQVILNKEVSLQVSTERYFTDLNVHFLMTISFAVRTDDASRTEPRHAEPLVRTFHKGTLLPLLLCLLIQGRKHVTYCCENKLFCRAWRKN